MNTTRSAFRPLLILASAVAACRGPLPVELFEEWPVGSGTWTKIAAEPAWVKSPPKNPGYVVLVVDSQSNLRSIALANLEPSAKRAFHDRVLLSLRTVIPSPEAEAAATAASSSLRLVRIACRDEVLTHDPVPGNTLSTAWGLYEVPLEPVLTASDEPHRSAARGALEKL